MTCNEFFFFSFQTFCSGVHLRHGGLPVKRTFGIPMMQAPMRATFTQRRETQTHGPAGASERTGSACLSEFCSRQHMANLGPDYRPEPPPLVRKL